MADEPLTPPTLYIDDRGERLRGQIRLAVDMMRLRRLRYGGVVGFALLFYGTTLDHPVLMPVVYLTGFCALLYAGVNIAGAIQIPQTIELGPTRFSIGDDELELAKLSQIDATEGPLSIVAVLRDGTRQVWAISADHHNLHDIAWLVQQVRARLG